MEGDDVAFGIEFVERDEPRLMRFGKRLIGIRVVGNDVHTEAAQYLDQLFRNTSQPDEAGCLAIHVEAHQSFQFEVSFSCAIDRTVDLAVEAKHQRDGILGDGMRRIGRYAYNRDASCRRFHVYVVESRATEGNQFDAIRGQQVDYLRVALVIDEYADHILSHSQLGCMDRKAVFIIMYFVCKPVACLVERLAVVTLRVEECNFYSHNPTYFDLFP